MECTEMDSLVRKAEILIEALPYIQKLYGKTVVIKYGGNAMISEPLKHGVMEDITLLKFIGMNPILVHGGGPEISRMLDKLDIPSRFVNGLRVTDPATMEIAQMVLVGKTNKEIVSLLNQKGSKAVGFCGIDGRLIECTRREAVSSEGEAIDLGQVGQITRVNTSLLSLVARDEYIPVVAPIGVGAGGESYNCNADEVAGEIAAAMKAEKLMFLTDVEGVQAEGRVLSALTIAEVHELIERKVIVGGMIPKVQGCIEALEKGVTRTHIIDGRIPHCILLEIFTYKGIGTMIMKERKLYEHEEL